MAQTLEQIAELAGVSRATVSRVINGGPYIRTEVRERVMRVITEHNFHPNAVARSLARRRTNAIGLLVPEPVARLFNDAYFPPLAEGVAQACHGRSTGHAPPPAAQAAARYVAAQGEAGRGEEAAGSELGAGGLA